MTKELKRILCVEDEPDIRTISQLALELDGGFEVEACGSGKEALERAPAFQPDLILLDVMMPDMDGPSTLQEFRRLPQFEATPVVFMTAKVQPQEIARYRKLGVSNVIVKPFDPMTLSDRLRQIWQQLHL